MSSKIAKMEMQEEKYKELIRQLEFQVEELNEHLEKGDQARKKLRAEFQGANDKIIMLEEELFESKTMANELLDKLKFAEEEIESQQINFEK